MNNPNSSNREKIFSGLSAQTVVSVGYTLCDMTVFALFSRLLTKEDFGYYAMLCAVLVIFQSLSDAGIGAAVIQKQNPSPRYIHTAFTMSLIVGATSALLLFALAGPLAQWLSGGAVELPLRCCCVVALLYSVNSVANALLLRRLNFMRLGLLKIVACAVSGAAGLAMAADGHGVYSLVVFMVVQWSLLTVTVFATAHYRPRLLIERDSVKPMLSFSGWLTLGIVVKNIAWQFDKLVLSRWLSVASLGAYNRPSGFIGSFSNQVNGILDTTLFPILSGIQQSRERLRTAFVRALQLTNLFSILFSLFFFFNAEWVINIFFGPQWSELVPVLRVVSLFLVFNVANRLSDCFLRSMGLVRQFFCIRLISLAITYTCLFVGVRYDIMGVACAMLAVTSLTSSIKFVYLCRKLQCRLGETLCEVVKAWRLSLLFLAMGVPFTLFAPKSWTSCTLFALLFAGTAAAIFLFFPRLAGEHYRNIVYPQIVQLRKKLRRRKG